MDRTLIASRGTAILITAACTLVLVAAAVAGPIVEFGDNGGFLKTDLKGQVYIENNDYGSGLDFQGNRTDIHFQRLRLTMTGMIDETWGFRFQTCGNIGTTKLPIGYRLNDQEDDANARDIRIIDAYGIAHFSPALNLKIGLTKIPVTRANLDDCFAPLTLDRSNFVYNAYGTSAAKFSRDLGVLVYGNFNDDHLLYMVGAFQGREGQSMVINPFNGAAFRTTQLPSSNLMYAGRLHYSFLDPELGSGYVGTHFGEDRILTIGVGGAYEASAAFKNVGFDPSTGAVTINGDETVDMTELAADLFFEYPTESMGTPSVNLQYLKTDFDDAYLTNGNPADQIGVIAGMNGQKEGGYGKLAWILPTTIGDEGLLQPYAIYENWDFAAISGVRDQTITQYGGGINYYIHHQNVRWTVEYLKTSFDKTTNLVVGPGNMATGMDDFGTMRTMMQFVF